MDTARKEKGALLAASLFYVLVAFEFFYMATPFAVYFYGVYGPGLNFVQDFAALNWIARFFMPHIARETASPLINYHEYFGMVLFIGGLLVFLAGVLQIYIGKLRGRAEVITWLYKYVRHPQYLALMISGLGMVIVWPRYVVLFSFVTMIFIYLWLARTEEAICTRKFPNYAAYLKTTGMFLPRLFEAPFRVLPTPIGRFAKIGAWFGGYVAVVGLSLLAAWGINNHAIRSLYGVFGTDTAMVALGKIDQQRMDKIVAIVLADEKVKQLIAPPGTAPMKLIGYMLPQNVYVSEVPMELPEGKSFGHFWPKDGEGVAYKVILTRAKLLESESVTGRDIVATATNKTPLIELHVDLDKAKVTKFIPSPVEAFYGGMPVPVY
jgi:protein-S-isoprenylcysteine O-methyltransferase Ste14